MEHAISRRRFIRRAAAIGAGFALGAGLALLAGLTGLGRSLAAVLAACAGLEGFFGFCVACRLHPWLIRTRFPAESRVVGLS